MKNYSNAERSELLSAYLDGELDETQIRSVEELLERDPVAAREFEELKALKSLLASRKPIPPSVGFWTRLAAEIEQRKADEANLLPFPRRYIPAVSSGAAIVVILLGALLFWQREHVVDYVSKQSERVQQVVENNVLKGSILPLFSNVDKNQALQFAMYGTMPLDEKAGTELRIDEDSTRWYSINVNRAGTPKTPSVTLKEFVDEVRPTRVQIEIIDSLLDLGRRKLEGSVFIAEDRAMAVHPELSSLNKVMLSGIAAALEPEQRVRFDRFLRDRRAPYTLTRARAFAESKSDILHTLRKQPQSDHFVVVTPDTVLVAGLPIDVDSVRLHYFKVAERQHAIASSVDGLMRRIAEKEAQADWSTAVPAPGVKVSGDRSVVRIQIRGGWAGVPDPHLERWVRSRYPTKPGAGELPPKAPSLDFEFGVDDSAFLFNLDLDSLMMRMMREGGVAGFQRFRDNREARERFFNMDQDQIKRWMDSSAGLSTAKKSSKLDSLMREMEKRAMQVRKQKREPE